MSEAKHKERYGWDPVSLNYVDHGACICPTCTAQREAQDRKAKALLALPEMQAAKEKLAAFEADFGPVEAGKAIFHDFSTEHGPTKLRSQKARGLVSAKKAMGLRGPYWLKVAKIEAVLPQQGTARALSEIKFPAFARPCPVRPRHGFVESRVVKGNDDLLGVLCETLRADPQGEVMIMRPLTGNASAVATDAGVVWGKGNDGVTSGKGKQFLIPVPKAEQTMTSNIKSMYWTFDQDIKGSAYMEIVEHDGKAVLVQVRDGPADTPVGGDYVPRKDYEVTAVLQAPEGEDVDLLKWEKLVLNAGPGTAVWLPSGSLTSHYAVHALARKLAVVTGKESPKIGDKLQPSEGQAAPLTKKDYIAMAKYVKRRIEGAKKSRAAFSVSVLHAMNVWDNSPHLLWMRMAGACMMARLLVSACVGEARHFYRCGPGANTDGAKSMLPWKRIIGKALENDRGKEVQRSKVLEKVYRYSIKTLSGMAYRAQTDFKGDWGTGAADSRFGQDPSSFGGKNWADSAGVAIDLCEAILAFERHPTEGRWSKLVMCYNAGVAAAHNGGRLLDKWAEWDEIDTCANTPQFGLLSPQAMFICTGVKPKVGDSLDEAGVVSWSGVIPKSKPLTKKEKAKLKQEMKDLDLLLGVTPAKKSKKTISTVYPKISNVAWTTSQTESGSWH